jgi:hypothetical protein
MGILQKELTPIGTHKARITRTIVNGGPAIIIDCEHCSFTTIMLPSDSAQHIAKRWARHVK